MIELAKLDLNIEEYLRYAFRGKEVHIRLSSGHLTATDAGKLKKNIIEIRCQK